MSNRLNENDITLNRVVGEYRNTNIEILRILMMLSLIAHHFVVNSGIPSLYETGNISINMMFAQVFGMWGKTAINVFTLITGYFMVSKDLTLKKILKLLFTATFYVYGFYLFFLLIGYESFSLRGLAEALFFIPMEAGRSYVGSMITMMLFIPFVNTLIKVITRRQFRILLLLLLIYFTVLASFLNIDNFDFVFWMITTYMIGAYIRLYPGKWDSVRIAGCFMMFSILAMVGSVLTIDMFGIRYGFDGYYFFLQDANKVLALVASVSIFVLFKNLNVNYNKVTNTIASATFGVLLVHANSATVRRFLWQDVFDNAGHYQEQLFIPYACGVVMLVYAIATVIELLRIKFIEKPLFGYLNKYKWINKKLW